MLDPRGESMNVFISSGTMELVLGAITKFSICQYPINGSKVGIGVSILNDKIGPSTRIILQLTYPIKLLSRDFKLSFGLKATANMPICRF
jgi:hypothetical protein